MKDYYRTLGVLDDAEDIIIRAAYKALAQRYHPDKWKGDSQEASKRMSNINEAYDVLSDVDKRKNYDEEYFRNRARDESVDEDAEANFISEEDENWKIAIDFYPIILEHFQDLKEINEILANTFKTNLINSQDFKNSLAIKTRYEEEYLTRFYGHDKSIRLFAKRLLLSNQKSAAVKVNKIVRLMGSSITYAQLYKKITDEFPDVIDKPSPKQPEAKKDYSKDVSGTTEKELTCNNCGNKSKMYVKLKKLVVVDYLKIWILGGLPAFILISIFWNESFYYENSLLVALIYVLSYVSFYFAISRKKITQCPFCGNTGPITK